MRTNRLTRVFRWLYDRTPWERAARARQHAAAAAYIRELAKRGLEGSLADRGDPDPDATLAAIWFQVAQLTSPVLIHTTAA